MAKSKPQEPNKIWRVGNFVLRLREVPTFGADDWELSEKQVAAKVKSGDIGTVEVLEASSLDGAWMTRFMPGGMMSTMLLAFLDGGNGVLPDKDWLEMVLTNLMGVSAIPNGHFHKGIAFLMMAYFDPTLLEGGMLNKKARRFGKEIANLRKEFLVWRKEYDKLVDSQEDSSDYDLLAEKAKELV